MKWPIMYGMWKFCTIFAGAWSFVAFGYMLIITSSPLTELGAIQISWTYSLYLQPIKISVTLFTIPAAIFYVWRHFFFHSGHFIAINRWRTFKWYYRVFVNFRDSINTSTVHRTVTDLWIICSQICVYVTALLQLGISIFFSLKRNWSMRKEGFFFRFVTD